MKRSIFIILGLVIFLLFPVSTEVNLPVEHSVFQKTSEIIEIARLRIRRQDFTRSRIKRGNFTRGRIRRRNFTRSKLRDNLIKNRVERRRKQEELRRRFR